MMIKEIVCPIADHMHDVVFKYHWALNIEHEVIDKAYMVHGDTRADAINWAVEALKEDELLYEWILVTAALGCEAGRLSPDQYIKSPCWEWKS